MLLLLLLYNGVLLSTVGWHFGSMHCRRLHRKLLLVRRCNKTVADVL